MEPADIRRQGPKCDGSGRRREPDVCKREEEKWENALSK